ncbi:BA75_04404T0 [Komagataella pastoris]|uniref:BA75_04404T0 n=1 Tax=Komagataella pastoris TaxID=4922 RepID=A0A1B2JJB1_PICPA|nr:BA75_04404T0 [Komagataella pastoris]
MSEWPSALESFVSHCFQRSNVESFSPSKKKELQKQLTQIINLAILENKLDSNNWSKQKLPIFGEVRELELEQKMRAVPPNCVSTGRSDLMHQKAVQPPQPFVPTENQQKKKSRELRFKITKKSSSSRQTACDLNSKLVGTNTSIEKDYYRLTSHPDPSMVRPLPILKKSLQHLYAKYQSLERFKVLSKTQYSYFLNQLKSLRQDLTVQDIQNQFTVKVYEFNTQLAIQNEDFGELNQCLTQLAQLYSVSNMGRTYYYSDTHKYEEAHNCFLAKGLCEDRNHINMFKFTSYRILYFLLIDTPWELLKIKQDLFNRGQQYAIRHNKFLSKSFKLSELITTMDYIHIVDEFSSFVNMDSSVLNFMSVFDDEHMALNQDDWFFYKILYHKIFLREQLKALITISKSYRQISLYYLKNLLMDLAFFEENQLSRFIENGEVFNCMGARPLLLQIEKKQLSKVDIKGQV